MAHDSLDGGFSMDDFPIGGWRDVLQGPEGVGVGGGPTHS
jgi:hypothetical protein